MDKLITLVTILVVAALFYTLHMQHAGSNGTAVAEDAMWVAHVHGKKHGSYKTFHDCVVAMKADIDVSRTPYSCSFTGS